MLAILFIYLFIRLFETLIEVTFYSRLQFRFTSQVQVNPIHDFRRIFEKNHCIFFLAASASYFHKYLSNNFFFYSYTIFNLRIWLNFSLRMLRMKVKKKIFFRIYLLYFNDYNSMTIIAIPTGIKTIYHLKQAVISSNQESSPFERKNNNKIVII